MTIETKTAFNVVGTRPIRPDGVDKVTGRANYGADISLPGMLYGRILRSPHAHARILSTPALIVGAFVERIKFSSMLAFTVLWALLVYFPVANWVWGGGWLGQMGLIDFAGGTVVHLTAGVAALVLALELGRRDGFLTSSVVPHNLTMSFTGAAMLWVGWFGFNAGSALAADNAAGMALYVTHTSAAAGALTWMVLDWFKFGKASGLGAITGMVAGLATITPAAGSVGPMGGLLLGLIGGVIC